MRIIAAKSFDQKSAYALLALLGIVTAYSTPGDFPKNLLKKLPPYFNDARKFASSVGISPITLRRVVKGVVSSDELDEDLYFELAKEIRNGVKAAGPRSEIPASVVKFLKAYYSWFKRDSMPAIRFIIKNISMVGDQDLARAFSETEVQDLPTKEAQQQAEKKADQITKKHIGKPSNALTVEDRTKLKTKNREAYREYLRARKAFNDVPKMFLQQFVRQKGSNNLVDYQSFLKAMKASDIKSHWESNFQGLIDDQGKIYTVAGRKIKGGISQPGIKVVMNPKYNPKSDDQYVFTLHQPNGNKGHVYTYNHWNNVGGVKDQKVEDLGGKIDSIRKKVKANLVNENPVSRKCATIINLVLETHARIGGKGNKTAGEKTFGISTLQVKHITKKGDKVLLVFPGKKGVIAEYLISPVDKNMKQTIANILEFSAGKAKDDYVFSSERKPTDPLRSSVVNRLFKACGSPVTIKYIRTLVGTQKAAEILKKSPFKRGQAQQGEVERWYKKAMEAVGAILNHRRGVGSTEKITGGTAIQSYISKGLQRDFFKKLGLRVPNFLAKID